MDEIDHMDESELDDIMKQNGTPRLKLTIWMMLDHVDGNEELDRIDVFTSIEFVQWTSIVIWMKLNDTHEMHDSNEMDSMGETKQNHVGELDDMNNHMDGSGPFGWTLSHGWM